MTTYVELTAPDGRTISVDDCNDRIIEVEIGTEDGTAYIDMDVDTAKQLLAALAVAIARAELQS